MKNHLVLARKYRPKKYSEVVGQDAIVTTLKNAKKSGRLSSAYLFSGTRGTGKTSLARLFAKALNCKNLSTDGEPCLNCTSCLEIAQGSSLDLLELDGASHRGIDEIRIITESVNYAPTNGAFKIYLIDEVHMLTKEAFNALLKTLEEPPHHVKFFFATTEPHKIPETILSRCQRFHLKRITPSLIVSKLKNIKNELSIDIEDSALHKLATYAEGSLRDAESLFDQLIAYAASDKIDAKMVSDALGVLPNEWFFALDQAFQKEDYAKVPALVAEIFSNGKDLGYFLVDLSSHFRRLLLAKVSVGLLENEDPSIVKSIEKSASLYTKEQCLEILNHILDTESAIKGALSQEITLEMLLFRILQQKRRINIEQLIDRLEELQKSVLQEEKKSINETQISPAKPALLSPVDQISTKTPNTTTQPVRKKSLENSSSPEAKPIQVPQPNEPQNGRKEILPYLESREKKEPEAKPIPQSDSRKKNRYDTLVQFAAVELDGTIARKPQKN